MPGSPASHPSVIHFWIDVGGTFTDCLALFPGGTTKRCKVLSSGVIKGHAKELRGCELLDTSRGEKKNDWTGWQVRFLGDKGEILERIEVVSSRPGCLFLADAPSTESRSYELSSGEEAPLVAIRRLLELPLAAELPPAVVRLGTTRGTNALLTRSGARTAFVTTRGFADILEIGYQNRPRLFDLAIEKRELLQSLSIEVDERLSSDGEVLTALDEASALQALLVLREQGVESLAICLLHAWKSSVHEDCLAEMARGLGFEEISLSSQTAPLIKIVARGDTTVMDAYLNPVLRTYVRRLLDGLGPAGELRLLTSAGGLVSAEQFTGKDSILSGPAGGVVGFARTAQAAGFDQAIGFDMGGTSTDVARFAGRFEREYETEKAGVRVVAPMMSIETVAAGGGSICDFDGVKLVVGPASAGADPGPACYGRGGPLTVTDMNLLLGRLLPEYFPFALDRGAVYGQIDSLIERIAQESGQRYQRDELAEGFLRIANAKMARAIRSISVARGCDPREHVLVAFGGAAPQHVCAVAGELGIRSLLIHPEAGILSAYGIGLAEVTRHHTRGVYQLLREEIRSEMEQIFSDLGKAAHAEVQSEGIAAEQIEIRRELELRYRGLDASLTVDAKVDAKVDAEIDTEVDNWAQRYHQEHRRLYGYAYEAREIEVVAVRVEASGRSAESLPAARRVEPRTEPTAVGETVLQGEPARVFVREELCPGDALEGPAIVAEEISTIVIDRGWRAEVLSDRQILLEETSQECTGEAGRESEERAKEQEADPIQLELFNHLFAGIAEQMGITLRKTASSVNVKERLDFSCALFTPTGDLVVNAPHMPVHLGAMAETVKSVLRDRPDLAPGDVVLTNDPYRGGSHLPDLTVVTPVHDQSGTLLFFTASRAHHAEIGGITPGSMPPFSKNLAEEGVLIQNFLLVDGGEERFDALRDLLTSSPRPSRSPDDNLADVAAQVAANQQGVQDLLALTQRFGRDVVRAYMEHLQDAAERKMRRALLDLPDGEHIFEDALDDGSPIRVAITVRGDQATIDFTGTGKVLGGNLNANRAIVTAAVLYVLRCLIDEEIPLNQGVLAPVEIVLPESLLNPPEGPTPQECAAVVGGNVETSQRVTDVLLGAFKLAAASQGTMNNLLFGDETFGYYETICGGAGATAQSSGASAVHTHMTNTRLTDPEVLEERFPVRLRRFAVRRGSGGSGRHRGGDGIVREMEFLRPLEVSLLTQRRGERRPFGLEGGGSAAAGRNTLVRRGGEREDLGGQAQIQVEEGDVLTVETPGGGGWGAPQER